MMKLRPYQQRTLDELNAWFAEHTHGNPIVWASVGAGKSIMIAEFCRHAVLDYPDYRARILMLVPTKELVVQNLDKLKPLMFDINIGVVSASLGRKDSAFDKDVVIATIGSVARNPGNLGRLDLIIIDECHVVNRKNTGQYRQLITDCQRYNPNLRVIGMTGTPFRGDGIWLTEGDDALFHDIAAHVGMRELLDDGYLSPLTNEMTGIQIDASDVRMQSGDFVIAELAKRIDQDALTEQIAQQVIELGHDRKRWLVYCVTIAHAEHMQKELKQRGITAGLISAKTPAAERDRTISQFKAGGLRCICNVAVLTTGFDVPELDLIALVRNTRSPVLYTQIAGRGMRLADHKTDCLWLDFTDTTTVMGPVDQIKGRSEPKKRQTDETESPSKTCPECGKVVATAITHCPSCGYEFPPPDRKINDHVSDADVISKTGFQTYPVSRVTYHEHKNRSDISKPPTVKVSYFSGMKLICSEFICFEHAGYARKKAEKWWSDRASTLPIEIPAPTKVNDALLYCDDLAQPSHIVVKHGGQWPELVRCLFELSPVEET